MSSNINKEINDSVWVVVLKTIAYIVGLLLAGMGTTSAAQMISII